MPIKVIKEGDTQKEVCVLSYSSYAIYKQCPHRYYLEKVAKVPLEKQDETYTIPGRIVHNAAADFFKTRGMTSKFNKDELRNELIKFGAFPTVNYDAAYGSFDKAWNLLEKSAENLQVFLWGRNHATNKFMSEEWFGVWNAPLYLSDNLAIQGAADLIDLNQNGTATLYDFKTSWNTANLSRDQLLLYSIAVKHKWDVNVTMSAFFLLPSNKMNYYIITDLDKEDLLNRLQTAANEILSKKENLPATKNDKCKFCPFYDSCGANQEEHKVESLQEGSVSFDSFGAEL